jgi:enoyl-CoA hydratase
MPLRSGSKPCGNQGMRTVLKRALNCQKKEGLCVIRICPVNDRFEACRLSEALSDLRTDILMDPDIRVIVLEGTDESSFIIEPSPFEQGLVENGASDHETGLLAGRVAGLAPPVIAAIQGDATGQGLELALACDMRLAAETSRFALTHVSKGVIPWDGGTQRLSRLVGRSRAMEMMLTGKVIEAQEALRIGLVNIIVPREEVMTKALETASEIARKGPIALQYAKEAVLAGMDMTIEQGLRLEADLYLLLHTTKDRTEGIQSFQNKRSPRFEGK